MNVEKKIQILAESNLSAITKLIRIGGSYGVTLPKIWVDLNMIEIEGEYYCGMEIAGNNIVFRPIEPNDYEAVTIREKEKKANGRS